MIKKTLKKSASPKITSATRFGRIEDGIVREILIVDILPPFTPEIAKQFIEIPDNVHEGWAFDGSDFSPPPSPPPPSREALEQQSDKTEFASSVFASLTPTLADAYIQNNVTDLASAKIVMRKMVRVLLYLVRRTDLKQ